jgi:SpoVK/Ycf46/Vps4 family AAA+-type ATPase
MDVTRLRNGGKCSYAKLEAERFCRELPRPFKDDAELLDAARTLFDLRETSRCEDAEDSYRKLLGLASTLGSKFHRALNLSSEDMRIVKVFRKHRLNRLEKEILLFLALTALGLFSGSDYEEVGALPVKKVQEVLTDGTRERLAIISALAEGSRLLKSGLVELVGEDRALEGAVRASDDFVDPLYEESAPSDGAWKVRRYEELLDKLHLIVQCLGAGFDDFPHFLPHRRPISRGCLIDKAKRTVFRRLDALHKTLVRHPHWPLRGVMEKLPAQQDELIIVALIGKELGFARADSELFTGGGLTSAVARSIPEIRHNLRLLRSDSVLRENGYIQVCGGQDFSVAVEDDDTLRTCEFELTEELLGKLKIKRKRKSSQSARAPLMTLDQLVLHEDVIQALQLAEAQFKYATVMMKDWGLGRAVPYGSGVTILFWGPPGVGKTAAAEALAHKLGKKIIVANYAEIQNCWVGQTEKNVVRIFRDAREADAVLLWDEADAMFYDRDSALRNWEVRDVNVLLQELERFSGVCILSTNRQVTLDKALERRIAIKVQFCKPDKEMALQIWRKIVPKEMPLADNVDFEELADADMTGGEIKNVLLNAARFALTRGGKSKVTMTDFRNAIEIEKSGRWSQKNRLVGFVKK